MNQARTGVTLWISIALVLAVATDASAATFRVTSKIFDDGGLNAADEHLVLFDQGLVYDLPQIDSRYVTVFDSAQKMVTLLDRQTQVQTSVGTEYLVEATARTRAALNPQQQAQSGLNAQVQPSNRVIGFAIRFGSLEYHMTTQKPNDASMAVDYGRFADLASRLNIVRRLGPPPFGRMTLNEHILARREIPLETTLTIRREKKKQVLLSTVEIDELTDADRKKIEEVRGMLSLYRTVVWKEFP